MADPMAETALATEVVDAPEADDPSFDLGAKKKKKKKKPVVTVEGEGDVAENDSDGLADSLDAMRIADAQVAAEAAAAAAAETPLEFATMEFGGGRRKKKRKKVVFEDDALDEALAGGVAGENGERTTKRLEAPQPWDGNDRDYTYEELLQRALQFLHGKNPSVAAGGGGGRRKISLQFPQVAREGTKKTVFLNFGAIAKSIHRQQDHLMAYLGAELGTSGNIQGGGRLVMKGRFTAEGIANILKSYMKEFVICQSCLSPDTVLMRDANTRLYFVSCESCGAHRSVANISAGYVARVTRRKKVG